MQVYSVSIVDSVFDKSSIHLRYVRFVEVHRCSFANNKRVSNGGAIFANNVKKLNISACNFLNNSATGNGGAIAAIRIVQFILTRSVFKNNFANVTGGGMFFNATVGSIVSPYLVIEGCVFDEGKAGMQGGGAAIKGETSGEFKIYISYL